MSPTNPVTIAGAPNPRVLSLTNGFGVPATTTKAARPSRCRTPTRSNKNYRLGHVQVYNLDIQKTLPHGTVVNIGYNGSKGGNLDIVTAPNSTVTTVTTPNAQAFTYEDSVAESRLQQLVVSARKRLEKGVSLQVVYQYSHSIDNASSIGGGAISQVQNSARLDLEEGNSSFDVRHRVTGNYVLELPFGPGRAFFNQGGVTSKILDGFGFSGNFTFATRHLLYAAVPEHHRAACLRRHLHAAPGPRVHAAHRRAENAERILQHGRLRGPADWLRHRLAQLN